MLVHWARGRGAFLALFVLGATVAAQSGAGRERQGPAGPGSGGDEEAEVMVPSALAFPRGCQDFEELRPGARIACLEGWEVLAHGSPLFSVRAADDVLGMLAPRPGSLRWLRVRDASDEDATHVFSSPPLTPPVPWNYALRLDLCLESLPGPGPAHPALVIQHRSAAGDFEDAFGVEFRPGGAELVVRGVGGDPASRALFLYSGATSVGQWIELELALSFDRGSLLASLGGSPVATLPVRPRRGTDLASFRLAYRGEGPGNSLTFLLDDVAIAFGSSVCEEQLALDFETEDDLASGLSNGQDLSTPPEFGELFAISGAGANAGLAIFDSTPGGPNDPSQDRDLLVGLGNLVILQNDQVPEQTVGGVFDQPNDDQDGGTVSFSFTTPLEPLSIDLVDIDQGSVQRATVTLVDAGGATRVYAVPAGWTGDRVVNGPPGFRTLDLTTLLPQPGLMSSATAVEDPGFDPDGVVLLAVEFGSSGALDNLSMRIPCVLLDFEADEEGTKLVDGQDISTPPEFGQRVSISSFGPNAGAALFDSMPGGPNDPSQDLDLLVGLGNLLILQNNQVPTQSVPGIFDQPNDDQDGGSIAFDFPAPASPRRLDLVDIDPGLPNGAVVVLTDCASRKRTFQVPAGWTEDLPTHGGAGFRTLDLRLLLPQPGFQASASASEDAGFDPDGVLRVTVTLGSSGALDNLCFCP